MRDRQLRRVMLGLIVFATTETGTWLAITVFAYERGGVGEAGIVAFLQLAVAALAAPWVAFAADRVRRSRVLAIGFGLQAICFGLAGTAMLAAAPVVVVYVSAALAATSVTFTRPAAGAVVPSMVETPTDLTAANVAMSFAMGVGAFLGPAAAGLLLAVRGPSWAFCAAGALMALMCVCTLRLQLRPGVETVDPTDEPDSMAREMAAGVQLLRRDRASRLLVAFLTLNFVVLGALDLAFVTVAIDLLGRTEATAGVLASLAGAGTVVGAIGSIALVDRRRLTWPLGLGVIVAGVAVAGVAFVDSTSFVALLFGLSSVGISVADTSGRTMLQGMTPDDTLARVFGVLEGLSMAGLALGGIGFSGLVLTLGIQGALVTLGLALPLAVILRLRRLLAIDRSRPEVDPVFLGFVRRVPIFAPLPTYTVEQLLVNFVPETHGPGLEIIRRGEAGHQFYLITEGAAEAEIGGLDRDEAASGERWVRMEPGEFFGEIALLRDIPRTATVRSGADGVTLQALDRDIFLEAVTGHPRSIARVESGAEKRLDLSRLRSRIKRR